MLFIAEKLSIFDVFKKLTDMHWNGRHFSVNNETTYLSDDNKILAKIQFDNKQKKIISADFTVIKMIKENSIHNYENYNPPNPKYQKIPYGKERREIIKTWFKNNPNSMILINTKYHPQLKDDVDLKKLIKNGFFKLKRSDYCHSTCRKSYLILK